MHQPQALGVSQELRDRGFALMCVGYPETDLVLETGAQVALMSRSACIASIALTCMALHCFAPGASKCRSHRICCACIALLAACLLPGQCSACILCPLVLCFMPTDDCGLCSARR